MLCKLPNILRWNNNLDRMIRFMEVCPCEFWFRNSVAPHFLPSKRENHVINHIKQALVEQYNLVIVVSAMGRRGDPYATDTLLDWVRLNGNLLSGQRERDMLLCCGETIAAVTLCSLLNAEHIASVVLNGEQAGITTNDQFGNAQIVSIQPQRILELLKQKRSSLLPVSKGRLLRMISPR